MNVLPDSATLGSFFVVLVCIMIISTVVIFNVQFFPSAYISLKRFILKLSLMSLIRKELIDYILDQDEYRDGLIYKLNKAMASRSKTSVSGRLYFVLWTLGSRFWLLAVKIPRDEFLHCMGLLYRPEKHVAYEVKFSRLKLCTDLLRFVVFPLWIIWFLAALAFGALFRLLELAFARLFD
jgi:hypothetical protein